MLVGISVKEVLLDVVPVSLKDVMGQPASVKRTNVSVTRDAVLQNHKLEAEHTTSITMIRLYTNDTCVNFCLLYYTYNRKYQFMICMGGYITCRVVNHLHTHSRSKRRAEMIILSLFCVLFIHDSILFLYFANCMGGSKPGTEVL